jgi:hypothetical protein
MIKTLEKRKQEMTPINDNITNKQEPIYHPPIHAFPIYGLVVCAVILILIGIYLQINDMELSGKNDGEAFLINGPATICFGVSILVFPIYFLITQYREKKKFDRNIFLKNPTPFHPLSPPPHQGLAML